MICISEKAQAARRSGGNSKPAASTAKASAPDDPGRGKPDDVDNGKPDDPDSDNDKDDEYDFGTDMLNDIKTTVMQLAEEMLQKAARDSNQKLAKESAAAAPAKHKAAAGEDPRMHDWAQYDQFVIPPSNGQKFPQVLSREGKVIGELRHWGSGVRYQLTACCFHGNHHGNCARTRGWKMNSGEPTAQVSRVLVRWLQEAVNHASTLDHGAAHRF